MTILILVRRSKLIAGVDIGRLVYIIVTEFSVYVLGSPGKISGLPFILNKKSNQVLISA